MLMIWQYHRFQEWIVVFFCQIHSTFMVSTFKTHFCYFKIESQKTCICAIFYRGRCFQKKYEYWSGNEKKVEHWEKNVFFLTKNRFYRLTIFFCPTTVTQKIEKRNCGHREKSKTWNPVFGVMVQDIIW